MVFDGDIFGLKRIYMVAFGRDISDYVFLTVPASALFLPSVKEPLCSPLGSSTTNLCVCFIINLPEF